MIFAIIHLYQEFEKHLNCKIKKNKDKKTYYYFQHLKNENIKNKDFYNEKFIKLWNKFIKKKIHPNKQVIDSKFNIKQVNCIIKYQLRQLKINDRGNKKSQQTTQKTHRRN